MTTKKSFQDTLIVKQPIKKEFQEPSKTKSIERQNRPPNALDLLIGSPSSYTDSGCSIGSPISFNQEMSFAPKPVNSGRYGPPSPQLPLEIVQTIEDLQNDKKFNTPITMPKKSVFFSAL